MKELKESQMGIIAVLALMLVSMKRRLPTRRFSSGITTLALAGIVLLVAAGSASANGACIGDVSGTVFGPGSTVTESCTLNDTMTCTTGKGLIVDADNIVINGYNSSQGLYFVLDGSTPGDSCTGSGYARSGIYNKAHDNVVIKNLEVKNFCNGIAMKYDDEENDYVVNATIDNCTIHDNGRNVAEVRSHGIKMERVESSTIKNCEIYDNTGGSGCTPACENGGNGIFLKSGNDNIITNNDLYGNKLAGYLGKAGPRRLQVTNNHIWGNHMGGIVLRCKTHRNATIEYNNVSGNYGTGIFIGGPYNTVIHNKVCNNMDGAGATLPGSGSDGCGINLGRNEVDPYVCGARWTNLTANVVCGNGAAGDIRVIAYQSGYPGNNTGDDNTGYTTFNWNDTGAGAGNCTYRCFTIDGYCTPVNNGLEVGITNLETDDKWDANIDTTDDYYSLLLKAEWDPAEAQSADVRADETLRIHACDNISNNERACNVTDHEVTVGEINAGGITENLTLNHFCRNFLTFPYRTWEESNWSGPAVMQMLTDHYRPVEPNQSYLNATGIAHNQGCNADLLYVDPAGMRWTLNDILHNTSSYGGGNYANYGVGSYDTLADVLHYMCKWHYLGPGAAPAYGDYSNWMAVRGIHTDVKPSFTQGSYSIYGFWINDPKDPGGIGENTYKTVDQWSSTYQLNLTGVRDCDSYKGKYVAVCEPPEDDDVEVTLAKPKPRLADLITPVLADKTLMIYDVEQLTLEKAIEDDEALKIVAAAIDGVNEELVPYDAEFADVFAKTIPGEPMLVADDGGDYYLVPFNEPVVKRPPVKIMPVKIEKVRRSGLEKFERLERVDDEIIIKPIIPIEPIKVDRTLVVVLVDAEDGSFKEASWVTDPVKYLPVSKVEALKLALSEISITDSEDLKAIKSKPTIELLYRDASPYHPDWKITIDGTVFYVSQDGTVSQE